LLPGKALLFQPGKNPDQRSGNISKLSRIIHFKFFLMLKKKMQVLAKGKNLSSQSKFEIISDSSASQLLGGVNSVVDCPKLVNCGTFEGTCANLAVCNRFT